MKIKDLLFFSSVTVVLVVSVFYTDLYTGVNNFTNFELENFIEKYDLNKNYEELTNSETYFEELAYKKDVATFHIVDGDYSEALKIYDEILEINSLELEAWYGKIFLLEKMGKPEESKKLLHEMNVVFLNNPLK